MRKKNLKKLNFRFAQAKGFVRADQAVSGLYSILALEELAKPHIDHFLPSHARWVEEFTDYRERYLNGLAEIMIDYLIMCCYGELRHLTRFGELTVRKGPKHWKVAPMLPYLPLVQGATNGPDKRSGMVLSLIEYDPREVLDYLERVYFNANWGGSGYGGPAWARVSAAAKLYWALPKIAFLDHTVDITHNGGLAFNKPNYCLLNLPDDSAVSGLYLKMLNWKAEYTPVEVIGLINRFFSNDSRFRVLLKKAVILGIVRELGYAAYAPKGGNAYKADPEHGSSEWSWDKYFAHEERTVRYKKAHSTALRSFIFDDKENLNQIAEYLLVSERADAVSREIMQYVPVLWGSKPFRPVLEPSGVKGIWKEAKKPEQLTIRRVRELSCGVCWRCGSSIIDCRCGAVCIYCFGWVAYPNYTGKDWCRCECPQCSQRSWSCGCSRCTVCDNPKSICYCQQKEVK